MKLRARIALLVSLTFGAVVLVLVGEGTWRHSILTQRYETAMQSGLRNAWIAASGLQLQRVRTISEQIANADVDIRAIDADDKTALAKALNTRMLDLRALRIPVRVEVVSAKGRLIFSSVGADRPQIMTASRMTVANKSNRTKTGAIELGETGDGIIALAAATPIFGRRGIVGYVAAWIDVRDLIERFAQSIGWTVFLVRKDRTLVSSSDTAALWQRLQLGRPGGAPMVTMRDGSDAFEVVRIDLSSMTSELSGAIITVRSVTKQYWRFFTVSALSFGLLAVVLILFLGFLHWYMRMSFRPLNAVIRVLNALSRGDTEVRVEARQRHDEIGRLTNTVESFRQAQVARMRLGVVEKDLDAAKQIQEAIQPSSFPSSVAFEIYAEIHTAREVGGDFYDFFELPDGKYGVVIADVSGKGMAAALFMAAARTVIRTTAQIVPDPVECIGRANDFLANDNTALMFVTAFYAVYDPESGRFTYTNAGHNPPYIVSPDGRRVRALRGDTGIALGVAEDMTFTVEEETLIPGESLLLYTDGVTEAMNVEDEEFGDERLCELLREIGAMDARAIVAKIVSDVRAFAGEAPQSDDITCLALKRRVVGSESRTIVR